MISVVLVTCNRLHLLRQCVANVLARTSSATQQIIIWDNASTDGTREYLASLDDPRIQVVRNEENVGTNAFARAFALTTQPFLIELDDDVIDAPPNWDRTLVEAFQRLGSVGYLAANVIDDGKSIAADIMYRRDRHLYTRREINGVAILDGPTGGWCTATSRAVYDQVGGFREDKRFTFWHEDAAYARAVRGAGYSIAILEELKVFHASGPAYSSDPEVRKAKAHYYTWRDRRRERKNAVKRFIERIPPLRALNRWLGLYQPPDKAAQVVPEGDRVR